MLCQNYKMQALMQGKMQEREIAVNMNPGPYKKKPIM